VWTVQFLPPSSLIADRVDVPIFWIRQQRDRIRSVSTAFKEQSIRYVYAALWRQVLLAKGLCPTKRFKNWPDQIVLCLAFVRRLRSWEAIKVSANALTELIKISVAKRVPFRNILDGFGQEVGGK